MVDGGQSHGLQCESESGQGVDMQWCPSLPAVVCGDGVELQTTSGASLAGRKVHVFDIQNLLN